MLFLIKNARIFTRIYAQYEIIYRSLYMVNRKNKVAVIGKNRVFCAVVLLAFLPII